MIGKSEKQIRYATDVKLKMLRDLDWRIVEAARGAEIEPGETEPCRSNLMCAAEHRALTEYRELIERCECARTILDLNAFSTRVYAVALAIKRGADPSLFLEGEHIANNIKGGHYRELDDLTSEM